MRTKALRTVVIAIAAASLLLAAVAVLAARVRPEYKLRPKKNWTVRTCPTCGAGNWGTAPQPPPTTPPPPSIPPGYTGISSAADLNAIRNNLNGKYVLTADIDLSGINFTPIGAGNIFQGVIDGQGHKITGLYINRPGNNVGLVGYLGSGGSIRNLEIVGANITGGSYVGALAGQCGGGSISNCSSSGNVKSTDTGTGDKGYAGGLVGSAHSSFTITNCHSSANVSANGRAAGGLTGQVHSSSNGVINCYATGTVTGDWAVGGLVGDTQSGATIKNSYSTGSVTGNSYVGGFVGWHEGASYTACLWDVNTSGTSIAAGFNRSTPITGKTTAEMKQQATYAGWDFNTIWTIDPNVNNGYPTLRE